jgi:hypothetical protein
MRDASIRDRPTKRHIESAAEQLITYDRSRVASAFTFADRFWTALFEYD